MDVYTPNEQRRAIGLKPIEHQRERYEPLICSRCGGQIDRDTMKCLYCLTEYEKPKKDTVKVYADNVVIAEFEVGE